jgi:hypothetical protein
MAQISIDSLFAALQSLDTSMKQVLSVAHTLASTRPTSSTMNTNLPSVTSQYLMPTTSSSHPSIVPSPFPFPYQPSIPTSHLSNPAPGITPVSFSLTVPPLTPLPKSFVQVAKDANISLPNPSVNKPATQLHPDQRAQDKV